MKKNLLYVLASAVLWAIPICAQQTAVPYAMSFEPADAAELANWVLNNNPDGVTCTDAWVVGNALRSDGTQGLYVSNDGGISSHYGNRPCVQFAYRDFELADGNYYVSFDWICSGESAVLYAGVLPHVGTSAQCNNMKAVDNSNMLPNVGTPKLTLSGAETWHNDGFQLSATNIPVAQGVRLFRLYFAWVSSATDSLSSFSAGIDNVQISNANCVKPTNMNAEVVSCDSVLISWEGSSSRYQLQYRQIGSSTWLTRSITQGNTSIVLESLQEGSYDFRVRGICYETDSLNHTDTLYSPYTYLSSFNLLCPEKHCINYTALTNPNVAICTSGTTNSQGYYQTRQFAFQDTGVVDFGWESINSRHTVIWDQTAYDERTNNQLKMIPSGFNASIRLGNWDYNYGAEAITYPFVVDEDHSILLLHYAIVLENPSGHDDDAMPRFVLEIKDGRGQPIDTLCGRVDLNPLNEDASWIHVSSGSTYGDDIVYKDWTLLGLNLDAYVGQTLQISVATYDCFWSAHYGYAYFTLDCAAAHIKNTSCGAEQSVEVSAPDGFNYYWHNDITPEIRTTQTITIGLNDPTDWTCTLVSKENEDCEFDLFVNTEPRYPVAEFEYTYEPKNCENRYVFTNNSFIRVNHQGKIKDLMDESPDAFMWNFGFDDMVTSSKNPGVIVFPEQGGEYYVTLEAMIGDGTGTCHDEKVVKLVVPAVGEVRQRTDTIICEGNAVLFHEEMYDQDGVYPVATQSEAGCLIVDTLYLKVVPVSTTMLADTSICQGEIVEHHGIVYDKDTTGDMVMTFQNVYGCDSVVVLHVNVHPRLELEIPDSVTVCNDSNIYIPVEVIKGQYDSMKVYIDKYDSVYTFGAQEQIMFPVPKGMFPNYYKVTLDPGPGACMKDSAYLTLFVKYSSQIMAQKYGFIALLNDKFNYGGFEYLSYEWYRNDSLLTNENQSYIHVSDDDLGASYHVVVTRVGDGLRIPSCDLVYTTTITNLDDTHSDVSVVPTLLYPGQTMQVTGSGNVTIMDMLGRTIATQKLGQSRVVSSMDAPQQAGMYYVVFNQEEAIKILVR